MTAIELGLDDRISLVEVSPLDDPAELIARNPSSKVPTLETLDCGPVYDSRVIQGYLASLAPEAEFFPQGGAEDQWRALTAAATCEAIMDSSVALRIENTRPAKEQSLIWKRRWASQIGRCLDTLPLQLKACRRFADFVELSTVVGLAYLDFRHPTLDWRSGRPELEQLLTSWYDRPSFNSTRFPAA